MTRHLLSVYERLVANRGVAWIMAQQLVYLIAAKLLGRVDGNGNRCQTVSHRIRQQNTHCYTPIINAKAPKKFFEAVHWVCRPVLHPFFIYAVRLSAGIFNCLSLSVLVRVIKASSASFRFRPPAIVPVRPG